MATWSKDTILLAASQVKTGASPDPVETTAINQQWLYKFGEGWINIGPIGTTKFYFNISLLDGDR